LCSIGFPGIPVKSCGASCGALTKPGEKSVSSGLGVLTSPNYWEKKGDILVIFNRYLKDLESEVRHPKNRSRTVTNLLSAATSSQYFRCSQVKRLGKRPVLWEDSFDQGIRLPAGVFRWQDDNRAVVHERKHADVDVNCGGAALGV